MVVRHPKVEASAAPTRAAWLDNARDFLASELTGESAFTQPRLVNVLSQFRRQVGAPTSLTSHRFKEALVKAGVLLHVKISPESAKNRPSYKPFSRYVTPGATAQAVGLSLRPRSYLSHGTAARLHGLLQGESSDIYVNKEQAAKGASPTAHLAQEAIDRAFRNKPRLSQYVYLYGGKRLVLISGKNTNDLGVIEKTTASGETVRITSLERTLVDLAVRPQYAGGVEQVLQAFRNAKDELSLNKVATVLRKLDYIYPYHQVLGFYLQRAGVPRPNLTLFRRLGLEYDFYLGNAIKHKVLDKDWRIYIPQAMSKQTTQQLAP